MRWIIVEVDGPGHDAHDDRKREQDIGLPTLRLNSQDVESGEAADAIFTRLKTVLPSIGR